MQPSANRAQVGNRSYVQLLANYMLAICLRTEGRKERKGEWRLRHILNRLIGSHSPRRGGFSPLVSYVKHVPKITFSFRRPSPFSIQPRTDIDFQFQSTAFTDSVWKTATCKLLNFKHFKSLCGSKSVSTLLQWKKSFWFFICTSLILMH